jgi:hypothetical protein
LHTTTSFLVGKTSPRFEKAKTRYSGKLLSIKAFLSILIKLEEF